MNDVQKSIIFHHVKGSTGQLVIKSEGISKVVFFKNGEVIFVKSDLPGESLIDTLYRQKKIDQVTFSKTKALVESERQTEESILLSQAILDANQLFQALKDVVQSRFENCFVIEDAEMFFEDALPPDIISLEIETFRPIYDCMSLELSLGKMPQIPEDSIPILTDFGKAYLAKAKLNISENKLVKAFNGKRRYKEIMDIFGGEIEIIENFIGVLLGLKIIVIKTFDSPAAEIPENNLDDKASKRKVVTISDDKTQEKSPFSKWIVKLGKPYHKFMNIDEATSGALTSRRFENILQSLKLDDIEKNYLDLVHREQAKKILDYLVESYAVLSNQLLKKKFFESLRNSDEPFDRSSNQLKVEKKWVEALLFASKKQYDAAVTTLDQAIELDEKSSRLFAKKAELLLRQTKAVDSESAAMIEDCLKKALSIDREDIEANYFQGLFEKKRGNWALARDAFLRVKHLKPGFPNIDVEIRVINSKASGKDVPPPLFGGLFSSKKND